MITALQILIAGLALLGWTDVYLLHMVEKAAVRILHHALPPVIEFILLLALSAWLGAGINALYRRKNNDENRPVNAVYVALVAPVYGVVGWFMLKLVVELAKALIMEIRGL